MPRFAANLSMMYNEHAFLDRFAAAAADGFQAVEYLFPYEHPAAELRARLDANGLTQALFNAPPGDWSAGDRGLAALPGREAEFRRGLEQALAYASALRCPRVHVMAGVLPGGLSRQASHAVPDNVTMVSLAMLQPLAASNGTAVPLTTTLARCPRSWRVRSTSTPSSLRSKLQLLRPARAVRN